MSREQIAALPYASLGVQVGSSPKAVVVLAKYDGEDLQWVSSDRVVLVTRKGRLIRTVGLAQDLTGVQFQAGDVLSNWGVHPLAGAVARYARRIDVMPGDAFNVLVECELAVGTPEEITILGRPRMTRRLREQMRVPLWDWTAENLFWVDPDSGYVWRSRQVYSPRVPPIAMEVLKRPAPPPST